MHYLRIIPFFLLLMLIGCSDDKNNDEPAKSDTLTFESSERSLTFTADGGDLVVKFSAGNKWSVQTSEKWLFFSPNAGNAGEVSLKVTTTPNTKEEALEGKFTINCGSSKEEFTVTQAGKDGNKKPVTENIDPATIPNYDKFFPNSEHGRGILNPNSKFSFARYKQSEHFFVFWDKYFGDDPNGPDVAADERVDVDDLLAKAEHFFETNITTLGMAVLGQGKSTLDQYKMQIYILDPTPEWWVATGSGYDDMIGALWVTPATCHPVGSTIAHEIGHSFQYQVYADKVNCAGSANDYHHGFRYGFGPNGAGGCGYWEQCAQWQAQVDYPDEMFTSYNFTEWVNNHHRHFHHEWMRYASYWLQSYWVEKHGIELYGRIWRESAYPDDAIETYTKLYNGGDYSKTREELFDYAMRMATFDIDRLPAIKSQYQGVYSTAMLKNSDGYYQPTLANCPGATGFNIIPLNIPEGGGKVSVSFKGLESAAPLLPDDPGKYRDGDGNAAGSTTTYNAANNMGWRYGFVAFDGSKRTYSNVGADKEGSLSFDVPAGTTYLYLVVQGSPEVYVRHAWDDNEKNDPMYPYAVKFEGTNLLGNFDIDPSLDPKDIDVTFNVDCDASHADYAIGSVNLATNFDLCQALVMDGSTLATKIMAVGEQPQEGKIAVAALNTDGTLSYDGKANNGFWLDAEGNNSSWGDNGYIFFEMDGAKINYGHYPGHTVAGKTYQMRPVLVYTKGGKQYKATVTINLKY